ncbi:hypothetical protein T12_15386 [Trichinella patagoniensis]|uniref:Uncharacterized protein n=1 Tax=Trichinella patagoniensis TaxID=990121 RepID=A0A0V0ZJC7_9BILA|nr:hypothetical protein T12_15386 [Trichinella patagoniensis]
MNITASTSTLRAIRRNIRNDVHRHHKALPPVDAAHSEFIDAVKGNRSKSACVKVSMNVKVSTGKALGVASGYAPGQIKICIFPQAMPQAIYSTIFDLRGFLCKFLIASTLGVASGYAPGQIKICIFPQAVP